MPVFILPDGSQRAVDCSPDQAVVGQQLAAQIGPGLAKAAIAMRVNGELRDLSTPLPDGATVQFLTAKDADGLDILRHTLTAQVLARAVKLLYPTAKLAIGPTIEQGFYYDVAFDKPLSVEELAGIEGKMREILAQEATITRTLWPRATVRQYFAERDEPYKVQIIDDAPADQTELSVYCQSSDKEGKAVFVDLCRGPHAPRLSLLGTAFKLTHLAGAYWRGDSRNEMLTRIYGIAFATDKELNAHLAMLEEAAKRDHRKIGKELDLFHFEDSAPGQPFWHAKGWSIYTQLVDYMRHKVKARGYTEVNTPQLLDASFWKYSGHWDKYRDNMFIINANDEVPFALKPMSCPGNVQIYKQGIKSYRDLPIRMAEFGKVFRQEMTGARHGLMRVQGFTQDDAHIFCTASQLEAEVIEMCDLIHEVYRELGFSEVLVKFSDRPAQRIGSDADWDQAEGILRRVCEKVGFNWVHNPGDGAFYAPKLDFVLKDAIGRDWQCGTIQVDLNLPTRLDMTFIDEHGEKQRPCMVHRAILGSVERFMGVLIEHYAGHFPLWLAPVQVVVAGISEAHNEAVLVLTQQLTAAGFRVEADVRNEKISYKLREHSVQKVPVFLALGNREIENQSASVRRFGSQQQEIVLIADLIARLTAEVQQRQLPAVYEKA